MKILNKFTIPIICFLWLGVLVNANSHLNDLINFLFFESTFIRAINFLRSISVIIVIFLFLIFFKDLIKFKKNNFIFFFYIFIFIQIISFFIIRDLSAEYDNFYFIINQFFIISFFYLIISLKLQNEEKLFLLQNLFNILIIFILLAVIYLGKNLYVDFFKTHVENFYYGYFVSPAARIFEQGVPRVTGIARLILILIIFLAVSLMYSRFKIVSFILLTSFTSMMILCESRFTIYSFFILSLILIIFDKKYSYLKKLIYFVFLFSFSILINFTLINFKKENKVNFRSVDQNLNNRKMMEYFKLDADEVWYLRRQGEREPQSEIELVELNSRVLEDFTTSGRSEDWKNNISFFKKRPVLGYGFQADRYLTNEPVSNAYLYSLVSGGIVGFLFFSTIAFLSFLKCFKAIFYEKIFEKNSNTILKCSVLINLMVLLRSLIENSFSIYNFDLILFLLTFMIISLNETNTKKNSI